MHFAAIRHFREVHDRREVGVAGLGEGLHVQ
jgi:hypothetical protein